MLRSPGEVVHRMPCAAAVRAGGDGGGATHARSGRLSISPLHVGIADRNLLYAALEWTVAVRKLLTKLQMDNDKIMLRMTGCPNGCGESLVSIFLISTISPPPLLHN